MKLLLLEGPKRVPQPFWETLEARGYTISPQQSVADCLFILAAEPDSAVLVDVDYGKSGVDAVKELRAALPDALILAVVSQEKLVALDRALEEGASDFLIKHPDLSYLEEIPYALARAKEKRDLRRQTDPLRREERSVLSEYILHITQDLKGPLAAMMGYIEIAASLIPDGAGPNHAVSLQRIDTLARHLLDLITNHVNALEIDAGKTEIHKVPHPLKQILDLAVREKQPAAGAKNIEIVLQAAEDLPAVPIDAFQFERALVNLITNAVNLSPAGGQITVATETRGAEFRIAVKDSGAGITDAERPCLFDRTKRLQRRGGDIDTIGLYVAERIINLHGGRIEVESDALEGNALIVCLPIEG
jgi:signal transduction histidine kinase